MGQGGRGLRACHGLECALGALPILILRLRCLHAPHSIFSPRSSALDTYCRRSQRRGKTGGARPGMANNGEDNGRHDIRRPTLSRQRMGEFRRRGRGRHAAMLLAAVQCIPSTLWRTSIVRWHANSVPQTRLERLIQPTRLNTGDRVPRIALGLASFGTFRVILTLALGNNIAWL
ncbi:hypothetical protein SCHPADRAFT_736100 [Schizopora paradoxa]|uniref:Uncharacterized protein n=1 Tax=Schizopora paradoxa TaxID=27342 RepID=A0A0H2R020_9AGAM|nr:hypothetical protein SCHPADRAFT_736100 [Schizopora paradoxa]